MNSVDGLFGGVLSLSVTNTNILLTSPAGFTAAPAPGPVQSQNAVLRLTGVLTASPSITLPTPGFYIIDNRTTTASFGEAFAVGLIAPGAGERIFLPVGFLGHVYSDGTDVRFVDLGPTGGLRFEAGLTDSPLAFRACTVLPYLLCDGAVYNSVSYPILAMRLGAKFGGNGSTTFGVPDLRGRVPMSYDITGRVTAAGCGVDGTVIGSAGGNQYLQGHAHSVSGNTAGMNANNPHAHLYDRTTSGTVGGPFPGGDPWGLVITSTATSLANIDHGHAFGAGTTSVGAGNSQNMIPTQVAGVWLIKT